MILENAKQQIKNLEIKLISATASHQSDKEAWEMNLQNLEETWRCTTFTFHALSNNKVSYYLFFFLFLQFMDAYQLSFSIMLIKFTVRCEAVKAQNEASSGEDLQRELEELKLRYKVLKVPRILLFWGLG